MAISTKPIIIDGNFTDWIASERIDYGDHAGLQPLCHRAERVPPTST